MKSNDKIIEEKISKTWEAKYEKWIGRTALSYHLDRAYRDKRMSAQDLEDSYNEIEQFILQALEQKEREMVETLESLKTKEYCCTSSECGDQARYDGRNNALDEAISNLKQPNE